MGIHNTVEQRQTDMLKFTKIEQKCVQICSRDQIHWSSLHECDGNQLILAVSTYQL